jgi:heterodisulfide reductase subunit A
MSDKAKGNGKVGSVLVVGGGIAGLEAALSLADAGYLTTIVTKDASIGGRMAQLDKTFPTNDCSTCMLSPRMVSVGGHPNIDIMILSKLTSLEGEPGNFTAHVHKKATYVDFDKCTGCEECTKKCPTKPLDIPNDFNEGINTRRAISLMFPQAVPKKCIIDPNYCRQLQGKKCGVCEKVCKAGAINYDDKDQDITLNVGAVILAPGYKLTDPKLLGEYGYGRNPNVVTSMEFERLLSASGPYAGHVVRPSDHKDPKKLAFIQCVGSRNERIGRGYCSSVCCMYATKQAIVGSEHVPGLDVTIFYKDLRAFGKGFDRYWENARDNYGVKYKRSMISAIREDPKTNNCVIRYTENGKFHEEEFDMTVLSCGLEPSPDAIELAKSLNVELNHYNFCKGEEYSPVNTSRPGVFVCGAFESPKDIPESVVQSTGAAGKVMSLLGDTRWSLTRKKQYPAEIDTSQQEPRIGVFVCHCGLNIASVIDVEKVRDEAKKIDGVVYADNLLFTCSQDSQEGMKEIIKENKLNRVVIAACSPRTHEPLFREMLKDTGINPYLFEMANIRDQDSWVHGKKPKEATIKAISLMRMAVAKSKKLEMLHKSTLKVIHRAVVLGGGISGMSTSLNLAEQGFDVVLVEQSDHLGGETLNLRTTLDGADIRTLVKEKIAAVNASDKITLHLNSRIVDITGGIGHFKSIIQDNDGKKTEVMHATVTIATGSVEYQPKEGEYGFGHDKITTVRTLEQQMADGVMDPRSINDIVLIQCVGSRNEEHNYCSRVCCTASVKNAIHLKEKNPDLNVYVMYRDIRTYGMREDYYRKAREMGVIFVRFDKDQPPVVEDKGGKLSVSVFDQTMGREFEFPADRVALAAGVVARENAIDVSRGFKLTLNTDGFFQEAHVKLQPIDFASEGEYLCGTAHSPMSVDEAISQSYAAAAHAGSVLGKDELESDACVAVVNEELCAGCVTCVRVCPYGIPKMKNVGMGIAEISPVECHGCGTCVGQCPAKAIELPGFKDVQLGSMIEELFTYEPDPA